MNNYNYLTIMILGKHRADYRETTSLINKIAQYMGQAFLVAAAVPVKGFLMVVDQDSLIVLYRCSCHTPMPFDFTGIELFLMESVQFFK